MHAAPLTVKAQNPGCKSFTTRVVAQIEGASGGDQHPLGSEYYTTLRSEADNDVNAATIASEEAEADIHR